MYIIEGGYVEE